MPDTIILFMVISYIILSNLSIPFKTNSSGKIFLEHMYKTHLNILASY